MSIKYVLFFAMCMTIGYCCNHLCISRLLLMTRLMSHLLSCFEVHLYHLFPHRCLQGRVGGCGWGGSTATLPHFQASLSSSVRKAGESQATDDYGSCYPSER